MQAELEAKKQQLEQLLQAPILYRETLQRILQLDREILILEAYTALGCNPTFTVETVDSTGQ